MSVNITLLCTYNRVVNSKDFTPKPTSVREILAADTSGKHDMSGMFPSLGSEN